MGPSEGGLGASGNHQGQTLHLEAEIPHNDLKYLAPSFTGQPLAPLHCSGTQRQPGQPLVVLRTCFWSGAGP